MPVQEGWRIENVAILLAISKWHHCSDGVKWSPHLQAVEGPADLIFSHQCSKYSSTWHINRCAWCEKMLTDWDSDNDDIATETAAFHWRHYVFEASDKVSAILESSLFSKHLTWPAPFWKWWKPAAHFWLADSRKYRCHCQPHLLEHVEFILLLLLLLIFFILKSEIEGGVF